MSVHHLTRKTVRKKQNTTTQGNHDERGVIDGLGSSDDGRDDGGCGSRGSDRIEGGRRRSTIMELRRTFAAANAAAANKTVEEGEEERKASAGVTASEGERTQNLAPAPFRGTFWDEEDGKSIFPTRRVSYNVHSGQRWDEKYI